MSDATFEEHLANQGWAYNSVERAVAEAAYAAGFVKGTENAGLCARECGGIENEGRHTRHDGGACSYHTGSCEEPAWCPCGQAAGSAQSDALREGLKQCLDLAKPEQFGSGEEARDALQAIVIIADTLLGSDKEAPDES